MNYNTKIGKLEILVQFGEVYLKKKIPINH